MEIRLMAVAKNSKPQFPDQDWGVESGDKNSLNNHNEDSTL